MSSKLPLSPKGDIAQLTRLGRFLVPYRWRVVGALVALVVAASCVLALGQGFGPGQKILRSGVSILA